MDNAQIIRAHIQGALADCIDPLIRIISDPSASAKDRIHAFEALADRGGLPAVKAVISQTISGGQELDSMRARREQLVTERTQVEKELEAVRKILPRPKDQQETEYSVQGKAEVPKEAAEKAQEGIANG